MIADGTQRLILMELLRVFIMVLVNIISYIF